MGKPIAHQQSLVCATNAKNPKPTSSCGIWANSQKWLLIISASIRGGNRLNLQVAFNLWKLEQDSGRQLNLEVKPRVAACDYGLRRISIV